LNLAVEATSYGDFIAAPETFSIGEGILSATVAPHPTGIQNALD
jgi:hypothetical protein